MREGTWSTGPTRVVSARITGVPGDGTSVTVSRDVPSPMPGQAAAVGGQSAATATVEVLPAGAVSARGGTPFTRRDWPNPGSASSIDVIDGSTSHRIFTGTVDGTNSSLADSKITVPLVDDTDALSVPVSHRPLFREMPPQSTDGSERQRMTGLINAYVVNLAARAAGFYNTPAMGGYCLLSVPLVGSTWPERGVLVESYRARNVGGWGRYQPGAYAERGPGTVYVTQCYATYKPDRWNMPWSGGITAERPLSITLCARQGQATSSYVACRWSGSTYDRQIRLAVTSQRSIVAQMVMEGEITTVAMLTGGDAGPWECATLRVRRMSTNVLEFQITTDTGVVKTLRTEIGGTVMRDRMWDEARVYVPEGCGINGVQINYTSQPPEAETFRRTFLYRPDTPLHSLSVMPALVSVTAGDLIRQQAAAECAGVWIDENGVLQWQGDTWMKSRAVVRELTSSELADARLEMDKQDVRRKVTVKYMAWSTRTSRRSSIVVHEGSKDEYLEGDVAEVIINPPDTQQWVQVDSTPRDVYGDVGAGLLNSGQGSYQGFTPLSADGTEILTAGSGKTEMGFAPTGPDAWKWTLDVQSLPTGADRIRTATSAEEYSNVKPANRDRGLPLLRAMGVATAAPSEASSSVVGPGWAPDLEHDVGWHIQDAERAKTLADFIAAELAKPKPRISDLAVLPDPRIQLGDKIRVTDTARTGLSIVGVVRRIEQAIEAGRHEMTLDLIVTEVTASNVTLQEFDAFYSGMTLSAVDTRFKGESLSQRDAQPLRS